MDPARVAQSLAARFLENGNYFFAEPLSPVAVKQVLPATAQAVDTRPFFEELGFSGLAVQSVGYEEGVEEKDQAARVHVYVIKGPRRAEREIPTREGNIPIQVNRIGRVVVRPEAGIGAANRGNIFVLRNRVACGSSCAPSGEPYAGTLGCLVRKRSNRKLYVLSNNHVLAACNHVPVGMPILAPASMDARPGIRAPGEVARHAEICELRSGVPTLVDPRKEDVALAEVVDPDLMTSWQGDQNSGFDTPHQIIKPRSGLRVKKVGRTTGLTSGTVEALLNTPFAVPYKSRFFTATVWFDDVWTVRADTGAAFALPGDSGSLVVTESHDGAVGIVFAASPQGDYGIIMPMAHVSGLFGGLIVVSSHGV